MSAPFTLERVTEPAIEPFDLATMKRHLRCFDDVTVEDADITGLIVGAREWIEDYTGRALIDQTWRLTIHGRHPGYAVGGDSVSGWDCGAPGIGYGWFGHREWMHWLRRGEILLRKAPIIAITAFVTVDAAGVETDVDAASYEVREKDSKWPRLVPLSGATWAIGGDLRVTFRAGFAAGLGSPDPTPDAALIPVRFKQAMKLWAEANYDRDKDMMKILLDTAERLVKSERAELSMA